jgi:RNA polymerase sigma-70 factor (ECF subfamily)
LDEAIILEAVRTGDTDAFAGIIEQYQLPITRYLYRLTGDWETARDLAQDTFVQAYKSILKIKFDTSFKAWLYRTATNNSHRFFRKYKPQKMISSEVASGVENLTSKDRPEHVIESLAIRETLRRVDKDRRVCLLLHFWEGLKYREIAGIIGISEEAVRKRVTRGCREFREKYRLQTG